MPLCVCFCVCAGPQTDIHTYMCAFCVCILELHPKKVGPTWNAQKHIILSLRRCPPHLVCVYAIPGVGQERFAESEASVDLSMESKWYGIP